MIKSSIEKEESDSKSEPLADGLKKGVNLVQQMFIAEHGKDNGMDSDEEINDIKGYPLKGLQKKAKKIERVLKKSRDVYTV